MANYLPPLRLGKQARTGWESSRAIGRFGMANHQPTQSFRLASSVGRAENLVVTLGRFSLANYFPSLWQASSGCGERNPAALDTICHWTDLAWQITRAGGLRIPLRRVF